MTPIYGSYTCCAIVSGVGVVEVAGMVAVVRAEDEMVQGGKG